MHKNTKTEILNLILGTADRQEKQGGDQVKKKRITALLQSKYIEKSSFFSLN